MNHTALTQKSDHKTSPDYLISIVVPVYNVEKHIHACIESIFKQNIDESLFEVIIVNDGTEDRSMEVIEDIIGQHTNITVINQDNLSLSVARNNGIAAAKGEYILMPDSDDLLIENSLKPLLDKALETKADLVVADFLEMTDEEINHITTIPQETLQITEKTGKELFLEDLNPHQCYVWRTLFRREFLLSHNLKFVPGIRYQDVPFTHECYMKAGKCLRLSWLLNIYRRGHGSATSSFDKKKAKDLCIAIAETWKLTKNEHRHNILKKLRDDIFVSFSTLICLISYSFKDYKDRKEPLCFLKQQIPDLYFGNGLIQITTSFMYKHFQYLFLQTHFYGRKIKKYLFSLK
jgi:glycosyltransferase involved in cell wall biosynthesis